ncbi:hypothetical protein [Janthinobacterium sp.]|uniref:hypothetical protein n=1 Tax=Janthinobacterium sp. TaxID=1871054 RepID=UPI0025881C81|nr:hypothetical protein [Janthinobacterium sp.]MCX7289601.1 hypothetical protein [Janthinobacterium sp.]
MTASTRNSINAARATDILATVKRCGAATIIDIADDLALHRETVRKRLTALVATGNLIIIEAASTHSRALYGMPDLDDLAEFDLYRNGSSNWPRGQHGRDYLVTAIFGAPITAVESC